MSIENLYIGFIDIIWQIFLKKWKLSDMSRASRESGANPGLVCRQPKSRTLFSTPHCLSKDENSLHYHQINVASNSLEKTTQAVAYQEMHVVSSPIEFYWKEDWLYIVPVCRAVSSSQDQGGWFSLSLLADASFPFLSRTTFTWWPQPPSYLMPQVDTCSSDFPLQVFSDQ